ncbi:peroxiredoxin [Echinicola shivajiensis]|uniref:peroxiredoxin n=1 Tax=Echinicola shivajiensis TaxID=1035916 RepID=UPI001BFC3504|nr:peroxiredoxin [Echinicola shivajiensis]
MAIKINSKAPDFSLISTSNKKFKLSEDFKGQPCLIFFYPKDQTQGCTKEVCSFRDNFQIFKSLDVNIVGISRDSIKSHEEFKKMHNLPFELLSDPTGEVCKKYDALIPLIKMPKRITYLLDKNHRIIAAHEGLFDGPGHVKAMIEEINQLAEKD